MKASEFTTEISWSDVTEDLTQPDDYIIARSTLAGDVDNTDVYLYNGGSTNLFFFKKIIRY